MREEESSKTPQKLAANLVKRGAARAGRLFDLTAIAAYPEYTMIDVKNRLRGREGLLLAGDLLCFVIFAVMGLRSHEEGITLGSFLRAAAPFQAGWLFIHFALGKSGAAATDSRQVARLWVPAWALGLILRIVFFDRSFAVTFAIVSLLFNGVLLMVWRSVIAPLVLRPHR